MKLILRSYWRSSCSWRVRIALNWKGLSYQTIPVHLVADGGHQHQTEHRSLNPMRELPVLLVDGQPLAQSVAIMEFIEEQYPSPPLLPKDPFGRARVRQLTEIINSGIQPIQNLRVMQRLGKDFAQPKSAQLAWSRGWIERGFVAFHELAEQYGGAYCVGNQLSFADLCLVPQLYNGRRFQVDLSAFPKLLAIEERLSKLPAFIDAHPDNQPDAA